MVSSISTCVAGVSTVGVLFGVALIPAGSAFAAGGCAAGATLVAPGICEITFAETPGSAWTPPAGITKLQALLVGGGGAVGAYNEYGGGGGDVILVELNTNGSVAVEVGVGGLNAGNIASTDSSVEQGAISQVAVGGENSHYVSGGASGNGFEGAQDGSGAGAGGSAIGNGAGEGLIVNEIDSSFDLFADDDRCFGGGGVDVNSFRDGGNVVVEMQSESCGGENGGGLSMPASVVDSGGWWSFVGADDDLVMTAIVPNTGNGGSSLRGIHYIRQNGSDGVVVLRYDATLAATGFESTGALALGFALFGIGVALATRRRRTDTVSA